MARQLDFMPDALSFLRPFNVYANYTLTHTEQVVGEGEGQRTLMLDDPPEHLANLALTYDNPRLGLEWTLSGNHKGRQLRDFGTSPVEDRYLDDETSLDFSANKTLYRKVSLFFSANNLLDTPERITWGDDTLGRTRLSKNEWFGPSYTLAIRYRC